MSDDADLSPPFTIQNFEPIRARYDISEDSAVMALELLNEAAIHSNFQSALQRASRAETRKKLQQIQKFSRSVLEQIVTLDSEIELLFSTAFDLSKLMPHMTDNILEQTKPEKSIERSCTEFEKFEGFNELNELLSSTTKQLRQLDDLSTKAFKLAGGNSKGRPKDESLDDFLGTAFQVYENFANKPFTLEWHSDGQPISEAACYCVDLVNVFRPEVTLPKIATTARKIRETHLKVSELQEISKFLDHFHKRSR